MGALYSIKHRKTANRIIHILVAVFMVMGLQGQSSCRTRCGASTGEARAGKNCCNTCCPVPGEKKQIPDGPRLVSEPETVCPWCLSGAEAKHFKPTGIRARLTAVVASLNPALPEPAPLHFGYTPHRRGPPLS